MSITKLGILVWLVLEDRSYKVSWHDTRKVSHIDILAFIYCASDVQAILFCEAQRMWPLTICYTLNSSPLVNFNQSLTSSYPLVSFQLLCSSDGLPVPEGAHRSSEIPTPISVCKSGRPPCPRSVSSLCTICAAAPPGFGTHFAIRRLTSRDTGSAFTTNDWVLELVRPIQSQCKLDGGLISISIKCALLE